MDAVLAISRSAVDYRKKVSFGITDSYDFIIENISFRIFLLCVGLLPFSFRFFTYFYTKKIKQEIQHFHLITCLVAVI